MIWHHQQQGSKKGFSTRKQERIKEWISHWNVSAISNSGLWLFAVLTTHIGNSTTDQHSCSLVEKLRYLSQDYGFEHKRSIAGKLVVTLASFTCKKSLVGDIKQNAGAYLFITDKPEFLAILGYCFVWMQPIWQERGVQPQKQSLFPSGSIIFLYNFSQPIKKPSNHKILSLLKPLRCTNHCKIL